MVHLIAPVCKFDEAIDLLNSCHALKRLRPTKILDHTNDMPPSVAHHSCTSIPLF